MDVRKRQMGWRLVSARNVQESDMKALLKFILKTSRFDLVFVPDY